jgi:hypothetical protein
MAKRTVVLVLGALVPPYPALVRTLKRTWAARDVADVDVLFYFGGSKLARHGRDLFLPVSDSYWDAGRKTLRAFEYVLDRCEFDFVFRTNCSTYVDLPNLRTHVQGYEPGSIYAGAADRQSVVDNACGKREYFHLAYGFGYLLSRDLVELTVRRQNEWDHSLTDDFALGRLLTRNGVRATLLPHDVVNDLRAARTVDTSRFLFRCKTDSSNRRGDIDVLLEIDKRFSFARGEAVERWFTPTRRAKRSLRSALILSSERWASVKGKA